MNMNYGKSFLVNFVLKNVFVSNEDFWYIFHFINHVNHFKIITIFQNNFGHTHF